MNQTKMTSRIAQPAPCDQSVQTIGDAVLVSGAGFAGLATAYWMNKLGYRVTVIEIASGLRKGGTPVDIEGETISILARMGLIDAVRSKALPPRKLEFKDADDSTNGVLEPQFFSSDTHSEKYEIHRDELLEILFAAVEGSVDILFNRSIVLLENKADGVVVKFNDNSQQTYSLVFGCDGNRSNTRRLAFEGTANVSYFMGGYYCIKIAPTAALLPANVSQIFRMPGRTALLNGYDNQTDIVLAFRTEEEIDYDYRDLAQMRSMIHSHFNGLGWKVPAMLDYLDMDDQFYFDKLTQIRMPMWSNGRVALVGDAGYCVSPVAGMGGSVAIIGAARLSDALERHGVDHGAAFHEYHESLRAFVDEVQEKAVSFGMAMMLPPDDAALAECKLTPS